MAMQLRVAISGCCEPVNVKTCARSKAFELERPSASFCAQHKRLLDLNDVTAGAAGLMEVAPKGPARSVEHRVARVFSTAADVQVIWVMAFRIATAV